MICQIPLIHSCWAFIFLLDLVVYLEGFSFLKFFVCCWVDFLFFLGFFKVFLNSIEIKCCFLDCSNKQISKEVSYLMTLKLKALILILALSQSQALCTSIAELDTSLEMSLSRSIVLDCVSCYIGSYGQLMFQDFWNIGFMYLLIQTGLIFLGHVHSPLKQLKIEIFNIL